MTSHPKPDISAAAVDDRDAQILAEPLNPLELEEALATDDDNRLTSDWNIIELAAEKWLSAEQVILSAPDGTAALREALRPFVAFAPAVAHRDDDEAVISHNPARREWINLTAADFRRAARAYAALSSPAPDGTAALREALVLIEATCSSTRATSIARAALRGKPIDAALSSPAPSPWQGMETAPKDGTVVRISRTVPPWGRVVADGYWIDERGISGWIAVNPKSDPPGVLGLAEPTEWHPLPPPPELTEKK